MILLASIYDPYYDSALFCHALAASVAAALVLIIWFDTTAFVEYGRLIGFKFEKYKSNEEIGIPFTDWLEIEYDYFCVRLICCPICLAIWLQIAGYFIHKSVWTAIFGAYFSLIFYFAFKIITRRADS